MAHDEEGRVVGRPWRLLQLVAHKRRHVGHDLRRRARQATLRRLGDATAPSALVPGEDLDAVRRELGEEVVVAVDVLAEAVHKDELGLDARVARGLEASMQHQHRFSRSEHDANMPKRPSRSARSTHSPGPGVEAGIAVLERALGSVCHADGFVRLRGGTQGR